MWFNSQIISNLSHTYAKQTLSTKITGETWTYQSFPIPSDAEAYTTHRCYFNSWSIGTLSVQSTANARRPSAQSQVALAHPLSQWTGWSKQDRDRLAKMYSHKIQSFKLKKKKHCSTQQINIQLTLPTVPNYNTQSTHNWLCYNTTDEKWIQCQQIDYDCVTFTSVVDRKSNLLQKWWEYENNN